MGRATRSELAFQRGLPALALDLAHEAPAEILLLGALDDSTRSGLEARGHAIETVPNGRAALHVLAWRSFDVVLVDPQCDDGIPVVKAVKLGHALEGVAPEEIRRVARRCRDVPLFVLPYEGDVEYALIVVAPELAYLESTSNISLVHAISRLDRAMVRELVRNRTRPPPDASWGTRERPIRCRRDGGAERVRLCREQLPDRE
ncbi:MAG: hypothetical protein HYV09_00645 [Deltaproteobacteria bacterium]|nr:hypothetical protein [Deltaproteobacteria bacterium]